ncbi:MAG TPA: C25 family cysteine peptidase [Thermoanaerobaculia bacterium]|nr:C25 family cysteine peptidase [Thermoanaerobaculia bacterium]
MIQRRLLIAVLFICAGVRLHAQATFSAQTSTTDTLTSAANTATLAHTTAAGTNRLLLVSVSMNINNATGTTVTSVTYGANQLTLLDAISDALPETRTEVWYLLNPAVGAGTVTVTAGGITPGQDVETVVGATTFSNADQSAPPSVANFDQGSPVSTQITGNAATDTVIDFVGVREGVTASIGGGQTAGYIQSTGNSADDIEARSSRRAANVPNTTMTWTLNNNRRWTHVLVRVRQATADLELRQAAFPDPVVPGTTFSYTLFIQNNGPSTATGITVTDPLPAGLTASSVSTALGSCSGTTTITCNLNPMTAGQAGTISILVTAPMTGGFIASNTATATAATFDPVTPNTATATTYSLVQATVCGTQPGKDGAGGTLAGVVNSYWPGTANAAVGATSIAVGARRGAAASITPGDLVLIIQMQDAAIDSNNDDRYGDGYGVPGSANGIGSGYTSANNSGRYEYVLATNTVGAGGGTLSFTAVGAGNGLVYAYTSANATATMGQRRYQVIRVPQYTTATLGASLTASAWNGTTGGILAIDVAGDLALGSITVNVNGLGFRGGAGLQRAGGAASSDDYRNVIGTNVHGIKGEGIAGTPEWVLDSGANLDAGPAGYPGGDFARGAPGTAGGGGTDGEPAANQDNSGGGGGSNWGRGGQGGNTWASNLPRGGFGGAPFYDSPGRVVMGGGGGAGARNNSSGIAAAGGAGGGIVLIRTGRLTGTGTITANGADAFNDTANDGGGGGGAGGSIVIMTRGGSYSGLTVRANGGRGGDAWRTQAPGAFPGERHGPGGGGGGGYIALRGAPGTSSVTGGNSGITTTANDTFGAQPGGPGTIDTTASNNQVTGIRSGCVDLSVATSDSPDPVIAGNQLTFTQSVTNNSAIVPAQTVVLTQTTPPGTTFVSMTPPAGWTCTTPSIGGTGTVTCTKTDPLAPATGSGNFTFVVATDPGLADGATITQPVSTSTSNPEPNTANNSASTTTTVIRRVDVAVVKTASDPGPDNAFAQGETVSYTIAITNNGPSRATNVVMTDPLPAGLTFTGVVPGGPTCTQGGGTVTCTYAAMNPGATNNVTISATIAVSQTLIANTASATRSETDTNAGNDSDDAPINVLAPTAVEMLKLEAVQDHKGKVLVSWTTTFESDNLGFNVYRQTTSGREKINRHLLAGSTLFSNTTTLTSGRGYRYKDHLKHGELAQYYIEDVDLDGTRTLHGPVMPSFVGDVPEAANTDTLADLGSVGGVFVSAAGIGAAKSPNAPARQLAQQWELAAQPAVKFMVAEEGWVRVTRAAMIAAGFDPGTDFRRLSLYTGGVEQPLLVDESGEAIEFYGFGNDTPWSGARAYWLVRDKGRNQRVKTDKTKDRGTTASTAHTVRRVERAIFFSSLTTNGDRDNFFGPLVTTSPLTQQLTARNVDRSGATATLQITLQGGTRVTHRVRVAFNGTDLGTIVYKDRERPVRTYSVPLSLVADGTNTLTLTALEGDSDVSSIESVELTYPHALRADDDALRVVGTGGTSATVAGFTSDRVRAFDVTDPFDPIVLEVKVSGDKATFTLPDHGTRNVLVIGASRIAAPAQIVPSRASAWNDRGNAADLVIVTARAFTPAAEMLAAKRNAEGIVTKIVDVQDLYDEFGYGERGPDALRELFSRTRSWKRAPRYAILLGDASFDPRNYMGLGTYDYVPTKLVNTTYLKTASDDALADFDGSGIPSIAIGRLPARTLAEAEAMIAKIVGHSPSSTNVVAVADAGFGAAAAALNALAPASYTKKVLPPNAEAFDSLVLTYVGHGSTDLWNAGFFSGSNAAALQNAQRPFVAAMTCLNGFYHDVFQVSMAESLMLNPNGGAVAVWASSALTDAPPQLEMAHELYRRLFTGARAGDAILAAKAATQDRDVRRSWIFFGDPSMKLQ